MATTTSRVTVRLNSDEERVARAHHLLIGLGAALVHRPFDAATHDTLRKFLTGEAAAVLASVAELEQRPEPEARERIAQLAGHRLRPARGRP